MGFWTGAAIGYVLGSSNSSNSGSTNSEKGSGGCLIGCAGVALAVIIPGAIILAFVDCLFYGMTVQRYEAHAIVVANHESMNKVHTVYGTVLNIVDISDGIAISFVDDGWLGSGKPLNVVACLRERGSFAIGDNIAVTGKITRQGNGDGVVVIENAVFNRVIVKKKE